MRLKDPLTVPLMNREEPEEQESDIEYARRRPPYEGTYRFLPPGKTLPPPVTISSDRGTLGVNRFSAIVVSVCLAGIALIYFGLEIAERWHG